MVQKRAKSACLIYTNVRQAVFAGFLALLGNLLGILCPKLEGELPKVTYQYLPLGQPFKSGAR